MFTCHARDSNFNTALMRMFVEQSRDLILVRKPMSRLQWFSFTQSSKWKKATCSLYISIKTSLV